MKTPFRGFTAILLKEFTIILRDRTALFFMFFPPLIQLIAFGFQGGAVGFPGGGVGGGRA